MSFQDGPSGPFGRQPSPYTVIVVAEELADRQMRYLELKRFTERAGDTTQDLGLLAEGLAFRVYPRAVND